MEDDGVAGVRQQRFENFKRVSARVIIKEMTFSLLYNFFSVFYNFPFTFSSSDCE